VVLKLLANENFPGDAIEALRTRGHDVAWVRTEAPGISDGDVLALATRDQRILITFDKDFGELAFRQKLNATSGVVLFRIAPTSASHIAAFAVRALESRTDWAGYFSVVEETRIRMTPLP
jgi:predicted nuclease of predicted toxin-antitoxin system